MYDRHKTIIKWYEYDATKLYKQVEAEDVTDAQATYEEPVAETASATGDPDMDAEVARIMAAFSGAKQDGVDSVFASMAAGMV